MSLLLNSYNHIIRLASNAKAKYYLFILSFSESSFFPIPPDVMLLPMCIANHSRAWYFALITTVGSVLGGIFGYFIGSIPFGLILTKISGLGDIRDIGSGNIGATNVLRTGNKNLALLTLILDGIKGALAIYLVKLSFNYIPFTFSNDIKSFEAVVAISAVIGHCFPIWLYFKGGKGVATGFGVVLFLNLFVGLIALLITFDIG